MFNSTREIGVKPYIPSKEFKQKVSEISKKRIDDYLGFSDKDFYQLKNGFISLYPNSESAHFRMIFDKN